MTTKEAAEVFSIVAAIFGIHTERVDAQAPVWVTALEPLDVQDTMKVVQDYLAGRGPERLPTVVAFVAAVKSLRAAERGNGGLQEDVKPHCPVCRDDGFVETGRGVYRSAGRLVEGATQAAPCPDCYRGKHLQYPEGRTGPWGEQGFWRGQPYRVVEPGVVELT